MLLYIKITFYRFRRIDCVDEPFHVGVPDGHRFTPCSAQKPILQRLRFLYYRVEIHTIGMDKEQIRYNRYFFSDFFSLSCDNMPFHRSEHLEFQALQHLVSMILGVDPFKVSHHKPTHYFILLFHWSDFQFGAYLSILQRPPTYWLSSSLTRYFKKFGLSPLSCLHSISL